MKIKKDIRNENYIIFKNGDELTLLADKNIQSKVKVICKDNKLQISLENKKKDNLKK